MVTLSSHLTPESSQVHPKSREDLIAHLTESLGLTGIDLSPEYSGYWLLQKNNTTAIFSLKSGSLIRLPRSESGDIYFAEGIALMPIILPGVMAEVFVSTGGETNEQGDSMNIATFGRIKNGEVETIDQIASHISMRTAVSLYITHRITRYRTMATLDLAQEEREYVGATLALLEEVQKRLDPANTRQ